MNNILAAFLSCVLFIFLVNKGAYMLFPLPLHSAEETAVAGSGKIVKDPEVSLEVLFGEVSLEMGQRVAKKCIACHTFGQGGKHGIGPNLWGILMREKTSMEGFSYSKVLKSVGGIWDYDALDAFLKKPSKYARGTKMSFAGLKKGKDRAAMILYLRSLGNTDTALPALPEKEEAKEE